MVVARVLGALVVAGLTGWGALALATVGPGGETGRPVLAGAYALAGLTAIVALCAGRWLKVGLPVFGVALVALAAWWSTLTLSNAAAQAPGF